MPLHEQPCRHSSQPPNLVYVFADQLRYRSCGFAGDERARTPNMDALAKEGVNFTQAVATAPVCTAYRAALLTGLYTTSNGMVINELRINPHQRCLGHVLTDGGYDTCYIGKWHLYANELGHHDDPKNSFVPPGPDRLGFDGEWYAYNFHHDSYGAYYHEGTPEKIFYGEGVYEADAQTDLAIDYLTRKADSDKPFALVLSWGPPHDPWSDANTPEPFRSQFDADDFPNPPNYRPDNDPYGDAWAELSNEERLELSHWRKNYYAQVANIDWNLGRLLKALDEQGLADNTLFVFTSDHGEMFGAHGRRAKNIFYEEACRVPLLMRWPGRIPAGLTSDACIGTIDLHPTLCGLLGLTPRADAEGMNLAHLALGQAGPEPDAALMMICGATAAWRDGHEWRALRDKRYTYAVYRRDGRELLFDNVNDPYQLTNLVENSTENSEYQETLVHFRNSLKTRLAKINDTFEPCSYYREHWTDGDRKIIRSATHDWSDLPLT